MSAESRPAEEAKTLLGLTTGWRQYAGLIALALALSSSLAALLLFPQDIQTSASWALQAAGVILFAIAVPLLFRGPADAPAAEPLTLLVAIFGLNILGVAIFMRFNQFADLPFGTWLDEADIGLRAQQILLDPSYRPVYLRGHALAYYFPALVALSFKFLLVTVQPLLFPP